jgi:hypothetical protein
MRWLVSPHRRVKAKRTSSVDADIEGTKLEIGSNSLFRRETLQVSLTSKATMNGNGPLSEAAREPLPLANPIP